MKKNLTVLKFIRRALLIAIALVATIVLSVYFLDRYKASGQTFEHEYPDEYWNDPTEYGFKYSDDIILEKEIENVTSSKYKPLYETEEYEGDTDILTKLETSRYLEELEHLYQELKYQKKMIRDPENPTKFIEVYDITKTTSEYESFAQKLEFEHSYVTLKAKFVLDGNNWNKYLQTRFAKYPILKNERFTLYMNLLDTTFELVEKDTQTQEEIAYWPSVPKTTDGLSIQNSILAVEFIDGNPTSASSPKTYDTSTYATNHETGNVSFYLNQIDEDEDGEVEKVQVYYVLKESKLDYTYFPERISFDQLRDFIDKCNEHVSEYEAEYGEKPRDSSNREIEGLAFPPDDSYSNKTKEFYAQLFSTGGVYTLDVDETYYISSPKTLSALALKTLKQFYIEWCGYDADELKDEFGNHDEVTSNPEIRVGIEYSLSDKGLEVLIPGNSVKTNQNKDGFYYRALSVVVLPYFTSLRKTEKSADILHAGQPLEGYVVIPDGSGAIMNFNNGKTYVKYNKRVYSNDLTFTSYKLTTDTNDILLPMYAYVYTGPSKKDQKVMVVETTDGAAQTTITVDVPRGNISYNYARFTIALRERQDASIGVGYYQNDFTQYTTNMATGDYRISYMCLDLNKYEATYNGVAKFYRDLIVERSEEKLDVNGDKTTSPVVNIDAIGAYSYKDNFIGITYRAKDSLTKADELQTIINEVLNLGVENINVLYHGWRKEGLVDTSFKSMSVSSKIGGRKALLKLLSENKDSNVNVYPFVEFIEYEKMKESFAKSHYVARDVTGGYATKYPYELNSNIYNQKADQIKVLSPAYYVSFANKLAKNYTKLLKDNNNLMAVSGLGSSLSGTYKKNKEVFKSSAVVEQHKAFEILRSKGIEQFALETPYAYALEYTSMAYNVPYESTKYEILDYSIPFYQLVVNGLFDYSGASINANAENGIKEQILRCVETGSNVAFTFSFEDSSALLQTNYNDYYYTLYSRWLEDVKDIYNELDNLGIYGCKLVSHERLDNNVFLVKYVNSQTGAEIKIVINYLRTTWKNSDGSITVNPKSYKII